MFDKKENLGRKSSKHWMEKLSGYSVKINPCSSSTKRSHTLWVGFKVGFTFFLNKLRLVLNVTKLNWVQRCNRMNQNKRTKPEPKSKTWGISIQCKTIFTRFILVSLKFCEWGKGVGLGENIQLKIKSKNDINTNLFMKKWFVSINTTDKGRWKGG